MPTIAVLVMAYGGPNSLDDVEPYLMDVRGGRPTSPEIIHEVRERYQHIGGRSPILERTQAQAVALEAALNAEGDRFKTFVGMRHWRPFIKDALAQIEAAGLKRCVGLAMAPHYSRMSIGAYYQKVGEAGAPVEVVRIERWGTLPGYLDTWAGHIRATLAQVPADERPRTPILFTAHSLPKRILDWGDPYPDELQATVAGVVERLGEQPYAFAYQSAAMTPDPWLGPDGGELITRFAAEGKRHLLVAPIGFVSEHVEVLYDVDIAFKQQAAALGMQLLRVEMPGAAPAMINGLAGLVRHAAMQAGWL